MMADDVADQIADATSHDDGADSLRHRCAACRGLSRLIHDITDVMKPSGVLPAASTIQQCGRRKCVLVEG